MRHFSLTSIFFLIIFVSCTEYEDVEFRQLRNLRVTGISNGSLNVEGQAVFFNPNSRGVRLRKSHINVYQDEREVAIIQPSENMNIKANSEFAVPVDIEVKLKDGLLRNVIGLLGKREIELHFKGEIKYSKYLIPGKVLIDEKQVVSF